VVLNNLVPKFLWRCERDSNPQYGFAVRWKPIAIIAWWSESNQISAHGFPKFEMLEFSRDFQRGNLGKRDVVC
jgi:hypothetical protein